MSDFQKAKDDIIGYFKSNQFTIVKDEQKTFTVKPDKSSTSFLTITEKEIENYSQVFDLMPSFKLGNTDTFIRNDNYKEALVDRPSSARGVYFPFRDSVVVFKNGEADGEAQEIVEVGPASAIYIHFFRKRTDRLAFLVEQIGRYSYSQQPTTLTEIFSKFITIKYEAVSVAKQLDDGEIDDTFESCLFELSYLKNRHFELRKEWPTLRQRKRSFSSRRIAPGHVFPLRQIKYQVQLLRFYQRGIATDDPYIKFISFYHIIEYFFISVSDNILYRRITVLLSDPGFRPRPTQLDKLILAMDDHKRITDETEMFKNVLSTFEEEEDIINFISKYEDAEKQKIYTAPQKCFGQELEKITLQKNHVLGPIAKRIKVIRNSLIHSSDRYERKERYIPGLDADRVLTREIPLLRHLAERIIIATAEH